MATIPTPETTVMDQINNDIDLSIRLLACLNLLASLPGSFSSAFTVSPTCFYSPFRPQDPHFCASFFHYPRLTDSSQSRPRSTFGHHPGPLLLQTHNSCLLCYYISRPFPMSCTPLPSTTCVRTVPSVFVWLILPCLFILHGDTISLQTSTLLADFSSNTILDASPCHSVRHKSVCSFVYYLVWSLDGAFGLGGGGGVTCCLFTSLMEISCMDSN